MKSIEKISNDIYDLRAKYLKIIETNEQGIAEAEKDISECEEGMRQSINDGDFTTYEKLSAKRTYSQGRKAMFEQALATFKEKDFLSRDEFTKFRVAIQNAATEAADERAKKMAALTNEIYSLGIAQEVENKELNQLMDAIRSMISYTDCHTLPNESTDTAWWGVHVVDNKSYKRITEKYPEIAKRKKSF